MVRCGAVASLPAALGRATEPLSLCRLPGEEGERERGEAAAGGRGGRMEDKTSNLDAVLKEAVDLVRSSPSSRTHQPLFDFCGFFPSLLPLLFGVDLDRLVAFCSLSSLLLVPWIFGVRAL